jgi:predicted ATP-dependent serine protease
MADKSSHKEHVALVDHTNDVLSLKDIKVPDKFFNRMQFGVTVLDELFGGQEWKGVLPGTSILFTGMPGAGKSTASLQFADLLVQNAGRCTLYNVGEENGYMVKMRADRLGITGNFGLSAIENVDALIKVCKDTGVEVLFQDSLQSIRIVPHCDKHEIHDTACKKCIAEAKNPLPRAQMLKAVTKKLHKFGKDNDVVVIIIGHITKGGDFAGPMEVKHDVDVHAHIRLNPETMAREFSLTKNRFGPAGIPYECNLTAKGLDFAAMAVVEEKPEETKSGGKAGERREKVAKLIKDALLGDGDFKGKPEKVSAYCVSRFKDPFSGKVGVDCSGGFWRAQLEKVRHELAAEGHIIGEKKIDGRTHIYVEI